MNLAIYTAFTDAAGDQLIVLSAKIQNQYKLMCHSFPDFLNRFQKVSFFHFAMIGLKNQLILLCFHFFRPCANFPSPRGFGIVKIAGGLPPSYFGLLPFPIRCSGFDSALAKNFLPA